jgi:hypothetical protein
MPLTRRGQGRNFILKLRERLIGETAGTQILSWGERVTFAFGGPHWRYPASIGIGLSTDRKNRMLRVGVSAR